MFPTKMEIIKYSFDARDIINYKSFNQPIFSYEFN